MFGVGHLLLERIHRFSAEELRAVANECGVRTSALRTGGIECKTLDECRYDLVHGLSYSPKAVSCALKLLNISVKSTPQLFEENAASHGLRKMGILKINRLIIPRIGGPPILESAEYDRDACIAEAYHRIMRSVHADEILVKLIRIYREKRERE